MLQTLTPVSIKTNLINPSLRASQIDVKITKIGVISQHCLILVTANKQCMQQIYSEHASESKKHSNYLKNNP